MIEAEINGKFYTAKNMAAIKRMFCEDIKMDSKNVTISTMIKVDTEPQKFNFWNGPHIIADGIIKKVNI